MRACSACQVEKPLTEYYPRRRGWICKPCHREREAVYAKKRYAKFTQEERAQRVANHKKWRKRNRHKARDWRLRKDYGIGIADYAGMLERQGGVCAICRVVKDENYSLHVDHCHTTGQVRGLLCRACNKMLGMARDNSDLLSRAAAYLAEPPALLPFDRFKELCQ